MARDESRDYGHAYPSVCHPRENALMVVGHWSILRTLVVSSDPGRVSRMSYDRRQRFIHSSWPLCNIHSGGAMSFHACLTETGDDVKGYIADCMLPSF
jgi:hypothetical protein